MLDFNDLSYLMTKSHLARFCEIVDPKSFIAARMIHFHSEKAMQSWSFDANGKKLEGGTLWGLVARQRAYHFQSWYTFDSKFSTSNPFGPSWKLKRRLGHFWKLTTIHASFVIGPNLESHELRRDFSFKGRKRNRPSVYIPTARCNFSFCFSRQRIYSWSEIARLAYVLWPLNRSKIPHFSFVEQFTPFQLVFNFLLVSAALSLCRFQGVRGSKNCLQWEQMVDTQPSVWNVQISIKTHSSCPQISFRNH